MTQVAMPFGVLLAADERMPPAYVEQAAAVLAEMLDQDLDGEPDDPALVELLSDRSTAWLAMPVDDEDWERRQLPRLERVLGYDIVIPSWWLDPVPDGPDRHGRAVIVEEIHHFITQFGLSRLHPGIFGVDDWKSVIARETRRARCDFWQHPENDCPGRPAEHPGDCSDPNCDVVEFYQQVVVMRAGMEPGWLGIGFPETAEELESRLGDEIKAAIDDPDLHQLRRPLGFDYPVAGSSPAR
jgi:AcrR family transcriptional regulator